MYQSPGVKVLDFNKITQNLFQDWKYLSLNELSKWQSKLVNFTVLQCTKGTCMNRFWIFQYLGIMITIQKSYVLSNMLDWVYHRLKSQKKYTHTLHKTDIYIHYCIVCAFINSKRKQKFHSGDTIL